MVNPSASGNQTLEVFVIEPKGILGTEVTHPVRKYSSFGQYGCN